MPNSPYVISGIARSGPHQGIVSISTTIDSSGGKEVDVYVSEGSEVAVGQIIIVSHSNGSLSGIVNGSGEFSIDLANLSSYSVGDSVSIILDTRSSKTLDKQGISKTVLVDRTEKIHDENYPQPVFQVESLRGHPHVVGNVQTDWTITRGDGQPTSETVTYPDGSSFRRTFKYTGDNLTTRSRWVKL